MDQTIAIVEDDPEQRAHYAHKLREHDYRVEEYSDRASAIDAFSKTMPDLAILDIELGAEENGGFEISKYLSRINSSVPILFLTGRGDELAMIYSLEVGAWDYQTKPVSLDYLVARVKSLLKIKDRNNESNSQTNVQTIGSLQICQTSMQAWWKNIPVELTPTEFEILYALVKSSGMAVTYDELINAATQGVVENNTINTHILHLRKKLKTVDQSFDCIKTKYGLGYLWVEK